VTSWRRGALLLLPLVPCVLPTAACGDERAPPARLIDGSKVKAPSLDLERVDEAVWTKVRIVPLGELTQDSAAAACIGSFARKARRRPVVRRVSVDGESVTFRTASQRGLAACDSTRARAPAGDHWCGRAYGRVEDGRLTDPRLDLACRNVDREPVAFAWIEPSANARFVAVRQRGYVEVYDLDVGLPIRITTRDVAVEESSASFDVSEYGHRGAVIRTYTLEAHVAG
jgi:hypothetical protein